VTVEDIRRIPITLNTMWPQALLIEPRQPAPRVAHFTGADALEVDGTEAGFRCRLGAAPGSPVALYLEPPPGGQVRSGNY